MYELARILWYKLSDSHFFSFEGTAPSVLVTLNRHLSLQRRILQGLWRLGSALVFLSLPSPNPVSSPTQHVMWPGRCVLPLWEVFPHCMAEAVGIQETRNPGHTCSPCTDCIWGEGWQAESDHLAVFVLIPYPLGEFKFPVFLRYDLWKVVRQTCISHFPSTVTWLEHPCLGPAVHGSEPYLGREIRITLDFGNRIDSFINEDFDLQKD